MVDIGYFPQLKNLPSEAEMSTMVAQSVLLNPCGSPPPLPPIVTVVVVVYRLPLLPLSFFPFTVAVFPSLPLSLSFTI